MVSGASRSPVFPSDGLLSSPYSLCVFLFWQVKDTPPLGLTVALGFDSFLVSRPAEVSPTRVNESNNSKNSSNSSNTMEMLQKEDHTTARDWLLASLAHPGQH